MKRLRYMLMLIKVTSSSYSHLVWIMFITSPDERLAQEGSGQAFKLLLGVSDNRIQRKIF